MLIRGTLAFMAGKRRRHRGTSPETTMERDHATAAVWSELGGYRLLRTVGRGEHCVAYLASGDGGQVVLKAYADDVDPARMANEVACLSAVDSPHVVGVIDVSHAPDRPVCLVLERLSGRTLSDWLRDRPLLDTGEVVTAAVSVLRGIRAVHAAGWVHGNVAATSIRFDENGCPVLLGFGSVAHATPAGVAADWHRCATIVDGILARAETIEVDEAEGVRRAIGRLRIEGVAEGGAVNDVERVLFALGPPAPLSMGPLAVALTARPKGPDAADAPSVPHRDETSRTRTPGDEQPGRPLGARVTGVESIPVRHRVAAILASAMEHGVMPAVSRWLRRLLAGRRRPVLIGAGGAVALTLVALLALPSTPAGHAEAPTTGPTVRTTRETRSSVPSPARSAPPTRQATDQRPADADDPVHAAFRLLQARHTCLERGDDGCLADVDQADSPLFAADRAVIAGGQKGQEAPELDRLTLTETIGDAAVVSVAPAGETTKPASVLLIKTEAGWRLRALFES